MFARMLANIAHSFAIAEIGAFIPYLSPVILGTELSYIGFVIGQTEMFPERGAGELHHIGLKCLPGVTGDPLNGEWVTVGITLFSYFSNITYSVVVGRLSPTPTYLKWKGLSRLTPLQVENLRRHYGILSSL
jgi:hypothetical protein